VKALAVGATGPNAGPVVPELVERGVEIRALVRAEGKADAARQRGAAEIAIGDLRDPGSLRAAVEGSRACSISIPPSARTRRAWGCRW
jgi:uncharacterized protein YbjT (DUF2867 family)